MPGPWRYRVLATLEQLQAASSGIGHMMEPVPPGWRRNPGSGALRPLDQNSVSLRDQPFPVQICRLIGRAETETVEVEHRTARASVSVHQGIRGAGGGFRHTEATSDRLDEGGLSHPEIALEGDERARRQRLAQRLT